MKVSEIAQKTVRLKTWQDLSREIPGADPRLAEFTQLLARYFELISDAINPKNQNDGVINSEISLKLTELEANLQSMEEYFRLSSRL